MQAHSLSNRAASHPFPFLPEPLGLAHDAGNLLNALGLYCDLLESPGVLKPEHRQYATELRVIADRSWRLLSRLGRAEAPPFAETGATSEDFIRLLRKISEPNLVFFTAAKDLAPLPVPAELLERIILNLVKNASEALSLQAHPCGIVHVSLVSDGDRFELTVEDNGPGMHPVVAAKFMSPQWPAVAGTRGLGHRILRELAQATGAAFEMKVRPGRGSWFRFCWQQNGEQKSGPESQVDRGGRKRAC